MNSRPACVDRVRFGSKRGARLFDAALIRRDEAETVGADHRTGLADEPVSDPNTGTDPDARVDKGVVPDHSLFGDARMVGDPRIPADFRSGTDDDERTDGRPLADTGVGVHISRRVNARRDLGPRVHERRQAGHGIARSGNHDRSLKAQRLPVGTGPDDGRPGGTFGQPFGIFRVHRKGEVRRRGARRLGGTGDFDATVAEQFGVQRFGDVFDSMAHDRPLSRPRLIPEQRVVLPRHRKAPARSSDRAHRRRAGTGRCLSPR